MSAGLELEIDRLGRESKLSGALTLLGALLFVSALVYGQTQIARIDAQRAVLRQETDGALAALRIAKDSLTAARCALSGSRAAIAAFHNRDYTGALALYTEALRCDPDDAYLLNLKAYAAFKGGDLETAIATQRRSLEVDPSYAWGFMDLGRFLCARGAEHRGEALKALERAIELRSDLVTTMRGDTELPRVCGAELMARVTRRP
jgi:tetratricopeptide (TPR) repeat protein